MSIKIEFSTVIERLFNEVKIEEKEGSKKSILINGDSSICRLVQNGVVSRYIFLDDNIYKKWLDKEENRINLEDSSYHGLRSVFANGIKEADKQLETTNLDIDSKLMIRSIKNKNIVFSENESPTEEDLKELNEFIEMGLDSIKQMYREQNQDFKDVEPFFKPIPKEKRIIKHLYIKIEHEKKINPYIPDNKTTRITTIINKEIDEVIKEYKEELNKRDILQKKIIKEVLNNSEVKEVLREMDILTKKGSRRDQLRKIIKQEIKVCQKCHNKTINDVCSNTDCTSVNPKIEVLIPYTLDLKTKTIKDKKRILNEVRVWELEKSFLGQEQEQEQVLSYKKLSKSILKEIIDKVKKKEHNIKMVIKKDEEKNTFIKEDGSKEQLEEIIFWEQYRSQDNIYSIIQPLDQIITPVLYDEVIKELKRTERNVDLGSLKREDEYKNNVYVVVSDLYGEIKSIEEGVLTLKRQNGLVLYKDKNNIINQLRELNSENNKVKVYYKRDVLSEIIEINETDIPSLVDIIHGPGGRENSFYKNAPKIYKNNKKRRYDMEVGQILYFNGEYLITTKKGEEIKKEKGSKGSQQWLELKRRQRLVTKKQLLNIVFKEYLKGYGMSPESSALKFQEKKENIYNNSFNELKENEWIYSFLTDEKGYQEPIEVMNPITEIEMIDKEYEKITFLDIFKKPTTIIKTEELDYKKDDLNNSIDEYEVISIRNVSPFLLKYLKQRDYINEITIELLTSDNDKDLSKIAILNKIENNENIEERISFIPNEYKSNDEIINSQLRMLRVSGQAEIENLSLSISIRVKCSFKSKYHERLVLSFLENQGLKLRERREKYLPISITEMDLMNLIL